MREKIKTICREDECIEEGVFKLRGNKPDKEDREEKETSGDLF